MTRIVVSGFAVVIPSIPKYFHEQVFDFYVPAGWKEVSVDSLTDVASRIEYLVTLTLRARNYLWELLGLLSLLYPSLEYRAF